MKILLLNPPKRWGKSYICRDENAIGTCRVNFLPSQPFLAAAYLRKKGKHADVVDVEDQNVSFDNYDVVVVFVCILNTFYEDIKWLKRAKQEGKKTITILNDAHEGLEMEAMQRYDFIDASVRLWEREIVLEKIISSWEENKYPNFPGVIYRKDGQLIDTGRMEFSSSLEHLPSCSDIFNEVAAGKYEAANITTGRGCPMPHRFCLHSRTRLRRRKIQDVVSELETLSSRVRKIYIMDPAMDATQGWLDEFCEQIIAKEIKVSWRTDIHVEKCTIERLRKMKKAGCDIIMFGVPTMDDKIIEKLRGGYNYQELKTAIQNLRRTGIIPMPVFDIGFPWDDYQSLSKIEDFLREVPLPWFSLRQVRPWKGTPLYEDCRRLGLLEGELGIDDYVLSSYPILNTLYLSKEEIQICKDQITKAAKLNPRYLLRFFLEGKRIKVRHFISFLRLILQKQPLKNKI